MTYFFKIFASEQKQEIGRIASIGLSPEQLQEQALRNCGDPDALNLLDYLTAKRKYLRVLQFERVYSTKCGGFAALHLIGFDAARSLGRHSLALAKIAELVRRYPGDPEYHALKGIAHQNLRQYRAAAREFEFVLILRPDMKSIPLNLVAAYQFSGKPCKAQSVLIRYVGKFPVLRTDRKIASIYNRLEQRCRAKSFG